MKRFCQHCNKKVVVKNISEDKDDALFNTLMLCATLGLWGIKILVDRYFNEMQGCYVCSICHKKI